MSQASDCCPKKGLFCSTSAVKNMSYSYCNRDTACFDDPEDGCGDRCRVLTSRTHSSLPRVAALCDERGQGATAGRGAADQANSQVKLNRRSLDLLVGPTACPRREERGGRGDGWETDGGGRVSE